MSDSKLDMPRGVLAAALIGWALSWAADFSGVIITNLAAPFFGQGIDVPFDQLASMTWMYVVIGLPTAVTVCFAFGWPLWLILDHRGVRGARNAALAGAGFGLTLALLIHGVRVFFGWLTALDENASYNSYSYGYQLIRDGLPTPLGWLLKLLDVGVTGAAGAAAGLAAWRFGQRQTGAHQTS